MSSPYIAKRRWQANLACCFGRPLTLSNLRAIVLLLVKAHFSSAKNFGVFEEELACLETDPDDPKGVLTIQLDHAGTDKNPSPKPSVWVNLESSRYHKKAMDDRSSKSYDNSRTQYVRMQEVVMRVVHVHESADMAIMMAESTADFMLGQRPHVSETLNLSMMDVVEISKPRLTSASPDKACEVDVVLRFSFNHTMSVNIESHRLKKFALEITLT